MKLDCRAQQAERVLTGVDLWPSQIDEVFDESDIYSLTAARHK
jgi:hypothetical protein